MLDGSALASTVATGTGTSGRPTDVVAVGGTVNLVAFDTYLRGRALYDLAADEASETAALAQFDAAIAADPSYAAAHTARARSLTTLANPYGEVTRRAGIYDAAIASAERATALEQARAVGDGGLIYARHDPMLDPLCNEPRFARLLHGMGFDGGTA
jgi:hypothetical protein